ncbi:hypothetical protein [Spirochaeta dissipatitropha]
MKNTSILKQVMLFTAFCVSLLIVSACASTEADQPNYHEPMRPLTGELINNLEMLQEQGALELNLLSSPQIDVSEIVFFLQKHLEYGVLLLSFSSGNANLLLDDDKLAEALELLHREYALMLGHVRVHSYQSVTMRQQLRESYRLSESLYERIIELTDDELERAWAEVEQQAIRREWIEREDSYLMTRDYPWVRLQIRTHHR